VNNRSVIAALAAGIILAGCSTPGNTTSMNYASLRPTRGATSTSNSLYVSPGGGVVVYSGSPLKYVRTISKGIESPEGLASNSNGQLFVANFAANTVTVYNQDGSGPIRTLSRNLKLPTGIALSSKGDLYVHGKNHVNIYLNSHQSKLKRINQRSTGIVIDSSDNVYIAGGGVVSVYPPGGTKPARTISQGLNFPTALAIDASGNLYVANIDSLPCGSVTVYNAATGDLEDTITDGICEPVDFAFDSFGNLYVGNEQDTNSSNVTVYAAGTHALLETITKGIDIPYGLSLDSSNNLYVSNYGANTITVYAPNKTSPKQTVQGVPHPTVMHWIQ
jgi:sugar lactone lactonase YvrE